MRLDYGIWIHQKGNRSFYLLRYTEEIKKGDTCYYNKSSDYKNNNSSVNWYLLVI